MAVMVEELSWWSCEDETLIAMIARDRTDDDYSWMVLARDKIGRFRAASHEVSLTSVDVAERRLFVEMAAVIDRGEVAEFGEQGDETNSPLDPFDVPAHLDRNKLHPYFVILAESPGRAPARKVISELALWLAPKDPHFVREFQTDGFDQRLWELFLWAAFRESMLNVEQLEAPDFRCSAPGIAFTVEATTVAPSQSGPLADHPEPKTPDEVRAFLRDYMAIKFGSALTSKLHKRNAAGERYWERPESREHPFVIAVADFHSPATEDGPGSMVYTQEALWAYLYGVRTTHHHKADGSLVITNEPVETHSYGTKTIPSGFFAQQDAENVSAVIFSNAGTLSKFDRMGTTAGYGAADHKYFRVGYALDPDPNAAQGLPFSVEVDADGYAERWTQELQVFHNPHAAQPLSEDTLPMATHHRLIDGQFVSKGPPDTVLSSMTLILSVQDAPVRDAASS
ncbi:hypothetical protein PNH50_15805 [Leisingera aquaemixtae]|uniref:hypothetical protein n=1 Tax=Leisingera aquaemixtae TaxID=1396826 RepID=UPI003983DB0B